MWFKSAKNQKPMPVDPDFKVVSTVREFGRSTSVLIGSSLLGEIGALLAIPFAGSIQIALREVLEARRQQVRGAHEALANGEVGIEAGAATRTTDPPPPS